MATPVTAPYAPSYATYTSYITPDEFLAEPTGVNVSQLIPGSASPAAQRAVLTRLIARSSSWADQYCRKILAATLDVQSGQYRLRSDGTIAVPVDNTPLIQVTNVALSAVAGHLVDLADLSGCRIGKKVVTIPVTSRAPSQLTIPAGTSAVAQSGFLFADVTYVNGYAHALTATATAAGAQTLQLNTSGLGIFPGLALTVYDGAGFGANAEQVVVGSGYTFGSSAVPLAAPMVNAHGPGCSVSALPGFVRQAVIAFTCGLIKTRGSDAYVMPSAPGRQRVQKQELMPGAGEDVDLAMELLEPLRRVW